METKEYGDKNASVVLLQPIDEHDQNHIENEVAVIRENSDENFRLVTFKVKSWNKDLSPWAAPAVFGKEDFGGCAADTLNEIMSFFGDKTKRYYIGGYSLAGLFALWAATRVDLFQGVAAASPSVWFPGFTDYLRNQKIRCRSIYLSLGDKEGKTRNPIMSTAGARISEVFDLLKEQNTDCVLEWNEGNHFKDADLRTAKAFLWVMKR